MKNTNEMFCKGQYLLSDGYESLAAVWSSACDNAADTVGWNNRFNHKGEFCNEFKEGALASFAVLLNFCGDDKIITQAEELGFSL